MLRAIAVAFALLAAASPAQAQEPRRGMAGDWSVEVWLGTTDSTFTFRFTRGPEELLLDWEPGYETADARWGAADPRMVTLGFERWLYEEREAYLVSPLSFRDRALLRIAQIRANIERAAREGRLTVCDDPHDPGRYVCVPGPDGSRGMFDRCVHRPVTPRERDATLASMRAELGRRAALVRENYRAWYSAVRALVARR